MYRPAQSLNVKQHGNSCMLKIRKWFIYTWVGYQCQSKCCSWILMRAEQICFFFPITGYHTLKKWTYSFCQHLLKTNLDLGFSCKVKTGMYCFKLTKEVQETPLVFTGNLSISGGKMTKYFVEISPEQRRKRSPPRGTHLTSIPLLSGRDKAEGHTEQQKGRRKKKQSKKIIIKWNKNERKMCTIVFSKLLFCISLNLSSPSPQMTDIPCKHLDWLDFSVEMAAFPCFYFKVCQ